MSKTRYTQKDLNEVKQLRIEGFSYWQISQKVDISVSTLNRFTQAQYDLEQYKQGAKERYDKRFKHKKDVFDIAADLVKKFGYSSTMDYINKEGYLKFRTKITPQLKGYNS